MKAANPPAVSHLLEGPFTAMPNNRRDRPHRFKYWLDASCLPGVRALVARNGYAGKVVEIDTNRFRIDESRAVRHRGSYHEIPHYIGQLDRYTELTARNLMRQIVQHVQTLHQHRVAHRDLYVEDIYVVQGMVQIQGFKLMQAVKNDSTAHWVDRSNEPLMAGVPFCAPENMGRQSHNNGNNEQPLSEAVDIWSLGALLYYLLVGVPPFRGQSNHLIRNKMSGTYWYDVIHPSAAAQNLIANMLKVDPRQRLTIQQVLDHEWMIEADEVLDVYDLSLTRDILGDWSKFDGSTR